MLLSHVKYLLFKLNVLLPSQDTINLWTNNKDSIKLKYVLQNGNYKTRVLAANALSFIRDYSAIPLLLNSIDDKYLTCDSSIVWSLCYHIGCEIR